MSGFVRIANGIHAHETMSEPGYASQQKGGGMNVKSAARTAGAAAAGAMALSAMGRLAARLDLHGRTALVTGRSGGLGLAIARELGRLGRFGRAVRPRDRTPKANGVVWRMTGGVVVEVGKDLASVSLLHRQPFGPVI